MFHFKLSFLNSECVFCGRMNFCKVTKSQQLFFIEEKNWLQLSSVSRKYVGQHFLFVNVVECRDQTSHYFSLALILSTVSVETLVANHMKWQ